MSQPAPFNPNQNSAPTPAPERAVKGQRLFIKAVRYETPENDFPFVVGARVDDPSQLVRVRLSTVEERVNDVPSLSRAKIEGQYVSNAKRRPSLIEKARDNAVLLSFDDARELPKSADGIPTYRAHWSNTMSKEASAEVQMVLAHVKLMPAMEANENGPAMKQVARVEVVRTADTVSPDSVIPVLEQALRIRDDISDPKSNARDPFVVLRVSNAENDKVMTSPRIYPARIETSKFDANFGTNRKFNVIADHQKSVEFILGNSFTASHETNRNLDVARAVINGMLKRPAPTFYASTDPVYAGNESAREKRVADLSNFYSGAYYDKVKVEVLGMEQIDFGKDSGVTYVSAKATDVSLKAYDIVVTNARGSSMAAGFAPTAIALHRHPDGEPYAVYASPVAMFPKTEMLRSVDVSSLPSIESQMQLTQLKGAFAEAPEQAPANRDPEVAADAATADDAYDNMP